MAMNERSSCFTDFVDGADVRVIESRGCTCLAAEAFQRLRVVGHSLRKRISGRQSDPTPCPLGLINDTHPTTAELSHNAVMGER